MEGNFRKIKFSQNLLIIVFRKYIFGNCSRFKNWYIATAVHTHVLVFLLLHVTASLMAFWVQSFVVFDRCSDSHFCCSSSDFMQPFLYCYISDTSLVLLDWLALCISKLPCLLKQWRLLIWIYSMDRFPLVGMPGVMLEIVCFLPCCLLLALSSSISTFRK